MPFALALCRAQLPRRAACRRSDAPRTYPSDSTKAASEPPSWGFVPWFRTARPVHRMRETILF